MCSAIFQNADLLQFWIWCLMKASHKRVDVMVGYQKVTLEPGQFIFGRSKVAYELQTTERKIRTSLQTLRKLENVTIKTTNKFSIVSIVNWNIYQETEVSNDQQNDQQVTSKRPASDHKQECKTHKNVKKKKNKDSIEYPSWLNLDLWQDYREHRKAKKSPFTTPKSENLCIGTLNKLIQAGNEQEAVINQSIERNWIGLFPVQGNTNGGKPKRSYKPKYDWAAAEEELQGERSDSIPTSSQHP